MEKDGLDHAGEDLGHVDADNLGDHLWEVDPRLEGLSLQEQIISELVQLPHNLRRKSEKRREVIRNGDVARTFVQRFGKKKKGQSLRIKEETAKDIEARLLTQAFGGDLKR